MSPGAPIQERAAPNTPEGSGAPDMSPGSRTAQGVQRFGLDDGLQETPMSPNDYTGQLVCVACGGDSPALIAPTTLHCGHSICARHVRTPYAILPHQPSQEPAQAHPVVLPCCPLQSCAQTRPSSFHSINIPQSSRVAYFPAPDPDPQNTVIEIQPKVADPKIDVTVSKIIALVQKAQVWVREEETVVPILLRYAMNGDDTDGSSDEADSQPPVVDVDPSPGNGNSTTDIAAVLIDFSQGRVATRQREDSASDHSSPSARPRKRRRRKTSSGDGHPAIPGPALHREHSPSGPFPLGFPNPPSGNGSFHPHGRQPTALARFEKELLSELTCEICFMLLYQPVTTPCQHTFCAKCLHRSLDHNSKCPLCRQELPGFSYFQDHPYNKVILSLILKAFPSVYAERGEAVEQEERDARLDTPIFVCQLSFPGMPTLLHFFEPRYRLMLRRCLESPQPCFGMIMPPRTGPPSADGDYGTMLEIRSVQMLPDGRSMVETWGSHRFRIMERGTLDGYTVGRIERVDDYPDDLDEPEVMSPLPTAPSPPLTSRGRLSRISSSVGSSSPTPPPSSSRGFPGPVSVEPYRSNVELIAICHNFLEQLREGTAPWVVQRLNNTYGPMPSDVSAFSFWCALVLPIDEHEKAKLLPIRSPRLRLRLVVHWIEQLNNHWWFSRGCTVV